MPNGEPCPFGDPLCPCQDEDMCHYEGPNAMKPPKPTIPIELAQADVNIIEEFADYEEDIVLLTKVYRAGLAAGIERAAKACIEIGNGYDNEWNRKLGVANDLREVGEECAAAIRALLNP